MQEYAGLRKRCRIGDEEPACGEYMTIGSDRRGRMRVHARVSARSHTPLTYTPRIVRKFTTFRPGNYPR